MQQSAANSDLTTNASDQIQIKLPENLENIMF